MTAAVFDRLVSSGVYFDQLADVTGAPFISSITGAQDGAALTITGTGFSASGNRLFALGSADAPTEITISTEGTTSIVSVAISATEFWLTRPTTFYVTNSAGVESNAVDVTIAPASSQRAFLVTQEFLGDPSTRIESNPGLVVGDEIRIRNVTGALLSDYNQTGQGAFDVDDGVTTFEAAVFDGEALGAWATQTMVDLVTTATVPDVANLTQAAATAAIQGVGLVATVAASVPSATVAIGSVIAQFPPAGQSVTLGGTVELTLSLGSAVALVPDMNGFPRAEAEAIRSAAGLTGVTRRVIDGNNSGVVVAQSVAPGTIVAVGSAVDLAVSSNLMPDLRGLLIQNAVAELAAAGLTLVDEIAVVLTAAYPTGYVAAQSPAADSVVAPGDPVQLTISAGAGVGGGIQLQHRIGLGIGLGV